MKRSIKLVVCMLLVATIAIPSVFATGLGESSKIVKVGTVDTTDVVYDVDIEWGDMIFNFVTKDNPGGQKYYDWEPNTVSSEENPDVMDSGSVTVTNKSTVAVNMDVLFTSNMQYVTGIQNDQYSHRAEKGYKVLSEMPEDWATGTYYAKEEGTYNFNVIAEETEFIAGKYYEIYGLGVGPYTSSEIVGVTEDYEGIIYIDSLTWNLLLEGGSLSDVRPGATIGTLTVTIS